MISVFNMCKKKKGRFLINMLLNKYFWVEKKDKINI